MRSVLAFWPAWLSFAASSSGSDVLREIVLGHVKPLDEGFFQIWLRQSVLSGHKLEWTPANHVAIGIDDLAPCSDLVGQQSPYTGQPRPSRRKKNLVYCLLSIIEP